MGKIRKFWKIFFGLVAVSIMSILLLELMVRVTTVITPDLMPTSYRALQSAFEREKMRMPDNYTGNKFKPNYTIFLSTPEFQHLEHTTSLIFDDVGFVDDGINGSAYGVVVGDSFTEGIGVPLNQKWVEVLEKNTGKDFVNMGFGAFSTTQAVRVFDKWGTKLNPKLVIYQLNPTDLVEDVQFYRWINAGSPGYYREFDERQRPLFGLRKFLSENFVLYSLSSVLFRTSKDQFIYKNETFLIGLNKKADFSTENYVKGFETAKNSLLFMKQKSEEVGVEMVIVIIPLREQLYFELEPYAEREKIFWPNTAIMNFCVENSIKCYDTTKDFENYKNDQIYFTYDGHFNERGYSLLASFVQKFLQSDNLI